MASIIAYTGEGERYWPLIERAIDAARSSGRRLIFYNADAASRLGANPLPTWWSSEGLPEQFGNRLDPPQLERAGEEELRRTVERARAQGIDAWGWLPSKRGAKELAEYAAEQEAELLIVPSDLEQKGLTGWLKGQPSTEEVRDEAPQPIIVVDVEQKVA